MTGSKFLVQAGGSRVLVDAGFDERPSEPVLVFLADKTEPGAWNLPLYKIVGDPVNVAGLVIDAKMHAGFLFEVYDLYEEKRIVFDLLVFIGAGPLRRALRNVEDPRGRRRGHQHPAAVAHRRPLRGQGRPGHDRALPVRAAGRRRGAGPVRVPAHGRFDGPPRVVSLGYQIRHGKLLGPRDMFDDPAYDRAMDYLRRHGPFEPHRLPLHELEYTTTTEVEERPAARWQPISGAIAVPEPAGTVTR